MGIITLTNYFTRERFTVKSNISLFPNLILQQSTRRASSSPSYQPQQDIYINHT